MQGKSAFHLLERKQIQKEQRAAAKRHRMSRSNGGGDAGDGGSLRKTSSGAIAHSDSGSSAVTRLRAGSAAGAVGAGAVSGV